FGAPAEDMPVVGSGAARFNHAGLAALYQHLGDGLAELGLSVSAGTLPRASGKVPSDTSVIIPGSRTRYLAEIAETVRNYHARTRQQVEAVRKREQLIAARDALAAEGAATGDPDRLIDQADAAVADDTRALVEGWEARGES